MDLMPRAVIALLATTMGCVAPSQAVQRAVLFNGGERAIVVDPEDSERVLDVDLKTGDATAFNAPAIGAPDGFVPEAVSNSGFLLGTSGTRLLACDPVKRKTVTVHRMREGVVLGDLAYNPSEGGVLVRCLEAETGNDRLAEGALVRKDDADSYRSPLVYVPKDPAKAGFVFCRRISSIDGFAFSPDGTLYLASDGDVWEGSIAPNDMGDDPNPMPWVLEAERIAPVAFLETSLGTSSSTGANEVTVGGNRLYIHSRRLGGSGMGDIFSILLTQGTAGASSGNEDLVRYSRRAAQALGSLEYIQTYAGPPQLAASTDGRHVAWVVFRGSGDGGPATTVHVVDAERNTSRTVTLKRK